MDFGEIYHFLFETYVGIGVLVAISLVLCVIIAAVLEMRTRKTYVDRGPSDDDDEWSIFDDDESESDYRKTTEERRLRMSNGARHLCSSSLLFSAKRDNRSCDEQRCLAPLLIPVAALDFTAY